MASVTIGNLQNQEELLTGQEDIKSKMAGQSDDISALIERGGGVISTQNGYSEITISAYSTKTHIIPVKVTNPNKAFFIYQLADSQFLSYGYRVEEDKVVVEFKNTYGSADSFNFNWQLIEFY